MYPYLNRESGGAEVAAELRVRDGEAEPGVAALRLDASLRGTERGEERAR